jgi:hypothetical protein
MIKSFIMEWTRRRKLFVLMAFHILWGLVLWFSISKYGLGISTDSVHMLFGALNFSMGRGLISFDGGALLIWPPLYPVLLALIRLATGSSVFASANILHALAFVCLSLCLSLLFLKIFPDHFLFAFAGNLLSDIGVVVLTGFTMVGSDYVHLALVVLFIWLAGSYLEGRSPRLLVAMVAVGMLAMLQRYLGFAVIVSGAGIVFLFSDGMLWQRILRSSMISLSALPAGIWLLITSRQLQRRAPITFAENFNWFSKSVLEWFFPEGALKPHLDLYVALLWLIVFGLILVLWFGASRHKPLNPYIVPVFIFGLSYLIVLFASASITYYNKLGGRFLLPLYIPFVTLLTAAAESLFNHADSLRDQTLRRIVTAGVLGALLIPAGLLARVTLPAVLESHANGASDGENVFNTTAWHENTAMQYWLSHPPEGEYLLFSNYPDGVAFYTGHDCSATPRKYSGPYGKVEFPVSQYAGELFSSGRVVYIIWIEPNAYSYFYKVEELSSIAQIDPLFVSKDGGVYRLAPAAAP